MGFYVYRGFGFWWVQEELDSQMIMCKEMFGEQEPIWMD